MLNTLIVGLGRAGLGLHVPVLARLRQADPGGSATPPLQPIVAVDPHRPDAFRSAQFHPPQDLTIVDSLQKARSLLEPDRTVVHVCTPPSVRSAVLRDVAKLGFTKIIVEKPLAASGAELEAVLHLTLQHDLRLSVVAPWLHSTLTDRLVALNGKGGLGQLQTITITQHKPRFRRSLAGHSHTCAFDVEIPHSLGLALRLAGDAEVVDAATTDLTLDDVLVPAMGSAMLSLHHHNGVHTTIASDLTSPVRARRVVLQLAGGRITADYPVGQDDDFAQLSVIRQRLPKDNFWNDTSHEVLRDDALGTFLARTYRRYAEGRGGDLDQHVRTCVLLHDAKRRAAEPSATATVCTAEPRLRPTPGAAEGEDRADVLYAGIGDEAGSSLDDQLSALDALGWSAIELRGIDGTAIAELDDATFAKLADRLVEAGLKVVCCDSRIGSWSRPITHPFELDLAELRILGRRCRELGTRFVRVMSYPNAGLSDADWRRQVLNRIRVLAEYAESQGVVLLHENCSGWAGSRADRVLDLLDRIGSPALALLFDTGNGVPYGYDAYEMLNALIPFIRHVHIKDAVNDAGKLTYTFPGHGNARVADCLRSLLAQGYTGALSIEPHIAVRPHEGLSAATHRGKEDFVAYGRELEKLVREQVLPHLPHSRAV